MLDVKARAGAVQDSDAEAILLGITEGAELTGATKALDDAAGGLITSIKTMEDFSGKNGEILTIYPMGKIKAPRLLLVGLGKAESLTTEMLRRAAAKAMQRAKQVKISRVAAALFGGGENGLTAEASAQAITEGAILGLYSYHGQKSSEQPSNDHPTQLELLADDSTLTAVQAGVKAGLAIAEGTGLARDLVNLPPNVCTPEYLAEVAVQIGKTTGLTVETLDRRQMETLKMGALLGVAQGSSAEPRFIIMEHKGAAPDNGKTLVLVGKGVTFDTGGYSLKDREGMVGMKADMAGGAAVIGAMLAVSKLNVPLHVVGLIPAADNMVSETAYRPQEVLTASNGTTIEIISTDAEGRLLLADALVYAKRYKPAAVVDIATLTGSMAIALGTAAAGFYCTDNKLRDTLIAAGDETFERVWPMPLYEEYKKPLESLTADTKNSGNRYGGAGQAALFLKLFVDYPAWAHIDMAGVAGIDSLGGVGDNPYIPKGGTGYGVRLFVEFVRRWG